MPPKKAKDETSNTKTDRDSNNPNLNLQSTPDIQVQNTKFDGIVLLSPAAQQLQKDLDSAIKDNISSTTKQKHGSINHLQMRELMDPEKGVNELEENLVNKLKASILVDVKGIREEIVSSFNSAAYDILQDVLGEHLPKVIQENETLKSMLGKLSAQVSNLQKEILELKNTLRPSVSPETSQLGQNPPFQNDFVINVKSQTSLPAPTQKFQGEVQGTDSTPRKAKLTQRLWASPEEYPDNEEEPSSLKRAMLYEEIFPALTNPHNQDKSSHQIQQPTLIKRGWAIASSSLPVPMSKKIRNETKQHQLTHLEISGDLPDFGNAKTSLDFLIPIINSRLCPALLCDLRKEVTLEDILSLVDITSHRKVKTWLIQFKKFMFTEFIFENRRKLSSLKQPSDPSSPKIYINPNLSPDDKFHQIKVLQAFNKLKFAGEDNKSSFSVYPQGFAIKIVCDAKKYFYSFDSKKSPKEFLKSKEIKFKE